MTALAGCWVHRRADLRPGHACERMLAAQKMYGPDASSHWSNDSVGLGRALFRTLPEDIYDRQPLHGAGDRYSLVADLRLDNRDELVSSLGIDREAALRACDAAILLQAIGRWGVSAVERLNGDFAFALWDHREQVLHLARDFLGQRPLYFHQGAEFFAFASMPKGLHALAQVPYAPDLHAAGTFLGLSPEGERSFFQHIERVDPGHVVSVTPASIKSRSYWHPRGPAPSRRNPTEYVEELRELLDTAVRARLRSNSPAIATHLSGGLDSGAVTATAAMILQGNGNLTAYTAAPRAGFVADVPGRIADEGQLAAETAARYPNIDHAIVRTDRSSPVGELDRYFWLFDRPVQNLCNLVWVARINSQAAGAGHRVVLTGQIGNLSLSYSGLEAVSSLFAKGALLRGLAANAQLLRAREIGWKQAVRLSAGPFLPISVWAQLVKLRGRPLGLRDFSALRSQYEVKGNSAVSFDPETRPARDHVAVRVEALRRVDPGNYNKGQIAGWQIDSRDPTADRRLVEFCLSVPPEEFVRGGTLRSLAKRALSDRLPNAVIDERQKGYQGADWFEGLEEGRDVIADEVARLARCQPACQILDVERLQHAVSAWPDDGWQRDATMLAYRVALLRGISTGHFIRKATGFNG